MADSGSQLMSNFVHLSVFRMVVCNKIHVFNITRAFIVLELNVIYYLYIKYLLNLEGLSLSVVEIGL